MKNRRVLVGVAVVLSLLLVGGLGAAWVVSEDVRAAIRLADAFVNAPETVRADPVALVRDVRELARLETASVQIEQRVRGQRGTDGTWGLVGERLDFVARAEVTAGVDLSTMGESDISVDEQGVVTVALPRAEIWHVDLDEEQSFVALRERGWLGWPDSQLETKVRQEAVRAVRDAAVRQGIEGRADTQARKIVKELLEAGGVTDVRFTSPAP